MIRVFPWTKCTSFKPDLKEWNVTLLHSFSPYSIFLKKQNKVFVAHSNENHELYFHVYEFDTILQHPNCLLQYLNHKLVIGNKENLTQKWVIAIYLHLVFSNWINLFQRCFPFSFFQTLLFWFFTFWFKKRTWNCNQLKIERYDDISFNLRQLFCTSFLSVFRSHWSTLEATCTEDVLKRR